MNCRKYVALTTRLYLEARNTENYSKAEKHLQSLGFSLSSILGRLLEKEPSWGSDRWIDYIVSSELKFVSRNVAVLTGFAVWGLLSNMGKQWIEPVEIIMQFSASGRRLPCLLVKFVDANKGIGAHPLKAREQLRLRATLELGDLCVGGPSGNWVYEIRA
jgi:hypothetical protein